MKTVHVIVLDDERMTRAKSAMLTQATARDRFRAGDGWHDVAGADWRHGHQVEEVNHFGRHQIAAGDVLVVERVDGSVVAEVQVTDIRMADTERLTPTELAALGYDSRRSFDDGWGTAFAGKAWLMSIERVTPQAQRPSTLH